MQTNKFRKKFDDITMQSGEIITLFFNTMWASVTRPFYTDRFFEQFVYLIIGSISITLIIGITIGLVMSLNFGHGLAKFGGTLYVPRVVSLSIIREMSPIFTSLLVAGRIGSGITAEIGAMNVTQQVDALRALGVNPVRYLATPRFLAAIIGLPILACIADILGIIGILIICRTDFDIPVSFSLNMIFMTVKLQDFVGGLLKAMIFGGIIAIVASYKGFHTKDGTRGVGLSTTWTVVVSSIAILISDFFLTKIFLYIW